jgi:hypothetical protein
VLDTELENINVEKSRIQRKRNNVLKICGNMELFINQKLKNKDLCVSNE